MFDQRRYENNAMFYLRWMARILSLATVSILFFFFIGEGLDVNEIGWKEWLGLLFFPLGLVAGLLISWKNEGLGATISVVSLLAFYFVYGFIFYGKIWQGWAFIFFSIPVFLFLIYWFLVPKKYSDFWHV